MTNILSLEELEKYRRWVRMSEKQSTVSVFTVDIAALLHMSQEYHRMKPVVDAAEALMLADDINGKMHPLEIALDDALEAYKGE